MVNADGSGLRNLSQDPAGYQSIGRPTWSPDGRTIAFDRGRLLTSNEHIYLMRADGGGQRLLNRKPEIVRDLAWSPDGKELAFAGDRQGNFDIYVIRADGGGLRRLTRNPAQDTGPSWSSDGSKIAFARGHSTTAIYVMNANGSNQRELVSNGAQPAWNSSG